MSVVSGLTCILICNVGILACSREAFQRFTQPQAYVAQTLLSVAEEGSLNREPITKFETFAQPQTRGSVLPSNNVQDLETIRFAHPRHSLSRLPSSHLLPERTA